MRIKSCQHLDEIKTIKNTSNYECEECIKTGDSWVHLRICQTCGQTLCCDSSPNKHATAHFNSSGHGVICSAEPGEKWLWCYTDQLAKPY